MTIFKIGVGVVAIIIIAVLVFLYYNNYFMDISVSEKSMGPYFIAYDEHVGDYKGTKVIQDDVYYTLLNTHGVETYKGFGIYYDDPKDVPKEKLRSKAGCVLEPQHFSMIEELKGKGMKITEIRQSKSLVVEFPIKSNFSTIIGIMKVHPAIKEYGKKKGLSLKEMMEIYDVPNEKIVYVMRVE